MTLETEVKTGKKDYELLNAARQSAAYGEMMARANYPVGSIGSIDAPKASEETQEQETQKYKVQDENLVAPIPPIQVQSEQMPKPENKPEPIQVQEEKQLDDPSRKKKIVIFSTAAIILIITIIGIIFTTPGALTGYTIATREVQQTTDFNQEFSQYTETELTLNNIIGLKISGVLEGTGAKVKLRINGTDYLVAEITNPDAENLITGQVTGEGTEQVTEEEAPLYTIATDKTSYALGETVTITITPETENKSLYVSYGEETNIIETNTYTPTEAGEYQAIALITLPDDILRLETNFTVLNESINETTPIETPETTPEPEPTPPETAGYEFTELCAETCNLPENSNPTLIIETEENSKLRITQITTIQTKENQAPLQTQIIPDIILAPSQTTALNLNEYFSDPDGDTVQYDMNEIPEIDATVNQNILTITSATPGNYTAFIYATDGDELVTSSTFQIIITSEAELPIAETNQSNETTQEAPTSIFTDCNDPNPNLRPPECIEGNEEQYFKNVPIYFQNLDRVIVARVTAFGNIIIKGKLVENSQASPEPRDFKISYFINNGETEVAAAWINTETGDLHIRGQVYEELFSILPTSQSAFLIQNKKGTNLAYFDRETGNLYLRGNLIQERPEQDITE